MVELRSKKWLEGGMQAEYYFAQGQILRRYLHRQYHVDVLDATTAELRERVLGISEIKEELWCTYRNFGRK